MRMFYNSPQRPQSTPRNPFITIISVVSVVSVAKLSCHSAQALMYRTSIVCIFCTLFFFGCQDDSDYLVGKYDVAITTELSSCGDDFFTFSTPYYLPTNHVAGQQSHMTWRISRIGITGTGAEKIQINILSEETDSKPLTLTGTMLSPWLHVETSDPFSSDSCDIQRVITLSGQLEDSRFSGTIRTTLAAPVRQAASCAQPVPIGCICEVTETFAASQHTP